MKFEHSVKELKGIGEKNAALFHKLNIETIYDLLFHFPREYETYPACETLNTLTQGGKTKGSVLACIKTAPVLSHVRGLHILKFRASDENGTDMQVTFFHMPYLKKTLKSGSWYVFHGAVIMKNALPVMSHPKMFRPQEYELLKERLHPVYMCTKGLTSQAIAKYCKMALTQLEDVQEYLPPSILQKHGFDTIRDCLWQIHMPEDEALVRCARARFAYEEFLFFLLVMKMQSVSGVMTCRYPMLDTAQPGRLIEQLPYQLTQSQKDAYEQIREDMLSGVCMNRLLQGDVGSGKTIVAILALLLCVSNGLQGGMMAPTEVLAAQHMETIVSLTKAYDLPFRPVLLTGSQRAKEKREIYEKIADGTYNIVIGTHAMIQDKVSFCNLALVVTDEQHRFGVRQRENLVNKGGNIHTIVMSATPIPRSLGMILYGDLAITEMKELPSDRLRVKNCVVDQRYRQTAYQFMQQQIMEGHQIYVICPMAQPGVMEELENVVDYAQKLSAYFPQSTKIAYLHGKMKPTAKAQVMERFAAGEIDILVSTTVIEVGINVPNATVMLVENAERFGLATLHQIRGRVGRGEAQSYCIFMQTQQSAHKNERLEILNHSNDGFEIANEDLKLRGPGDFMGVEQSGAFHFRFADIYRDAAMLTAASADADELLKNDSLLMDESHIPLKGKLEQYLCSGYLNIL